LAIVILGIGLFVVATRWGIGLSPDSAYYISGARGLLRGDGISFPAGDGTPIPISLWPPMYHLVLAFPMSLGVSEFTSARWINGTLYTANILIVYQLLVRATKGSRYSGLVGAFIFLVSVNILTIHTWAWSEALFLFLGLSGYYFCARYLEDQKKLNYVLSVGLLAGATLTRYLGVAFLVGASVGLFFFIDTTLKKRVHRTGLFLFLGLSPVVLWMVRNLLIAGSTASRSINYRGVSIRDFINTLHVMTLWFIPGRFVGEWRLYLTALGVSCLFLFVIVLVFRHRKTPSKVALRNSLVMLLVTTIAYTGIVVFAKAFMEPNFALDDPRFLTPILVFIILIGVLFGHESLQWLRDWVHTQKRILTTSRLLNLDRFVALVIFVYFCSFNMVHLVRWVDRRAERGQGYASVSWQNSVILEYVRNQPDGTTLYSNGYDVITLLLDRPVYRMPLKLKATPEHRDVEYDAEISEMADRLRTDQGMLVYFKGITWRRMTTDDDIKEQFNLIPILQTEEGAIYNIGE
jgi:hypothetical protein